MQQQGGLAAGQTLITNPAILREQDILDFAAAFDPQPYHLNAQVAADSIFGGLCASGWQLCALAMRLLTEAFRAQETTLMGIEAVSSLRWKKPAFAGETLTASAVIADFHDHKGRDSFSAVHCDVKLHNQDGVVLLTFSGALLVQPRPEKQHD